MPEVLKKAMREAVNVLEVWRERNPSTGNITPPSPQTSESAQVFELPQVHAYESAQVQAFESAQVQAFESSQVCASESPQAQAFESPHVRASESP